MRNSKELEIYLRHMSDDDLSVIVKELEGLSVSGLLPIDSKYKKLENEYDSHQVRRNVTEEAAYRYVSLYELSKRDKK